MIFWPVFQCITSRVDEKRERWLMCDAVNFVTGHTAGKEKKRGSWQRERGSLTTGIFSWLLWGTLGSFCVDWGTEHQLWPVPVCVWAYIRAAVWGQAVDQWAEHINENRYSVVWIVAHFHNTVNAAMFTLVHVMRMSLKSGLCLYVSVLRVPFVYRTNIYKNSISRHLKKALDEVCDLVLTHLPHNTLVKPDEVTSLLLKTPITVSQSVVTKNISDKLLGTI